MLLSKVRFFNLLLTLLLVAFLLNCSQKSNLPEADIDNGGLFLPDGFDALAVIDSIGRARHLAVNKNGDIYVKLAYANQDSASVAIRDINKDGQADQVAYFGDYKAENGYGPTSMRIYNGYLYMGSKSAVYRQKFPWL